MTRHSYLRQGWGHSLLTLKVVEPGVLKGLIFCRNRMQVNDEIEWRVPQGRNIGKVTECRCLMDPIDMYEVTVVVTERIPE